MEYYMEGKVQTEKDRQPLGKVIKVWYLALKKRLRNDCETKQHK